MDAGPVVSLAVADSLAAALAALDADAGLRPIAGGVGVMLDRALLGATTVRWMAVARLAELRERKVTATHVRIGAATTLTELSRWHATPSLLRAAVAATANPGVREVATLGGNVVAGRGDSDPVAALVALGGRALLARTGGWRETDVEDLIVTGPEPGELVVRFELPAAPVRWGWRRLTTRGSMDASAATVAVVLGPPAQIAVAFVSSGVLRLPAVESAVDGGADGATIRAAAVADVADAQLRSDLRASAAYRRHVIPVLVARAVHDARNGAADG